MDSEPLPLSDLLSIITSRDQYFSEKVRKATASIVLLTEEISTLKRQNSELKVVNEKNEKELTRLAKLQNECTCKSLFKSPPGPLRNGNQLSSTPSLGVRQEKLVQQRLTPSMFKVPLVIDLCSTKKRGATPSKIGVKLTPDRVKDELGTSVDASDESLATTIDPSDTTCEEKAFIEGSPNDSLPSTVSGSDDDLADTQNIDDNSADSDSLPPTYNPDNDKRLKKDDNDAILKKDEDEIEIAENPIDHHSHHHLHNHHHLQRQGGAIIDPSPVIPSKCNPIVPKSHDDSYDLLPAWREKPANNPCVEVVRRKADRRQYHGVDCAECREYYAAVGGEHRDLSSRHRANQQLPETPEGFWDLSWREDPSKAKGDENVTGNDESKQKSPLNEDLANDLPRKRRRQPFKPPAQVAKLRHTARLSQSPSIPPTSKK